MNAAKPELVLVAAVARNRAIGSDDRLLWRLSTDLKRFKTRTLGKPIIMGRKTFASIGRPLPGRETIVITRDESFDPPGVLVAHEIDAALALAAKRALAIGASEIIVAGGGEIYAETIGRADRLAITEVEVAPEGDVFFPTIDPCLWREEKRETGARGSGDEVEFAFVDYVRRR